jgi:hypothetical protein
LMHSSSHSEASYTSSRVPLSVWPTAPPRHAVSCRPHRGRRPALESRGTVDAIRGHLEPPASLAHAGRVCRLVERHRGGSGPL